MSKPVLDEVLKAQAPEYYTDELLLTMTDGDKAYAASVGYGRVSTQVDIQKAAQVEKPVAKKAPAKKTTARKGAK